MNTMKKTILWGFALVCTAVACQQTDPEAAQRKEISDEVIEIHDEIMPLTEKFDRSELKIDSILNDFSKYAEHFEDVDSTELRQNLLTLKENLEEANEQMMTWMNDYELDNSVLEYHEEELKKIQDLENTYHRVNSEREELLNTFK